DGWATWTGAFSAPEGCSSDLVRQVDAAGNNGATASLTFTLDTQAPSAPTVVLAHDTGSSSGDDVTSDGSLTVTPAEAGGTIQYSIDGGASWNGSFTPVSCADS